MSERDAQSIEAEAHLPAAVRDIWAHALSLQAGFELHRREMMEIDGF
jgi:hypothetical protein